MSELSKFTEKQFYAYNRMSQGTSVFITGPAGVGKTVCIKLFVNTFSDTRRIALTSTTGASALLLGGTTLHSYLGIGLGKDSVIDLAKKITESTWIRKKWTNLDCLIIDEISMLSPELFDKLEEVARIVRNNNYPFGGIQLVLSGDFLQLPCVGSTKFCFEAETWNVCINETIYFTEILRQDDVYFQKNLNNIRIGNLTDEVIDMLNTKIGNTISNEFGIKPTRLYSKNADVDRINDEELDILAQDGREFYQYDMTIINLSSNAKTFSFVLDKFKKNCNAPETLQLCEGAQVMLLKNLDLTIGLSNGSRGVVTNFVEDKPVVKFLNGIEMLIDHNVWTVKEHKEEILRAVQIPLRVAYAITIHKSQGCSLDFVEIDLSSCFEYGQAYVALSRAKTLDGMTIVDVDFDYIKAHPKALEYYKNLKK